MNDWGERMTKKFIIILSLIGLLVISSMIIIFSGKKIKVTFIVDGVVYEVVEVKKGDEVTPPEDPSKVGFEFIGWDKDFTNVTEDLEVNAEFEVIVFEVSFLDDDSYVAYTLNVKYGEKLVGVTDLIKPGYSFLGWFLGEDLFDFNTNIIVDLTLKAKFIKLEDDEEDEDEEEIFIVTFKDVEGIVLKEAEVSKGSAAVAPSDPSKVGYTFIGWDKDFSNVTADLEVKAIFKVITLEVKFVDEDENLLDTKELNYGSKVDSIADLEKVGFIFSGWYLEDVLFDFDTVVTNDLTLVGKFEVVTLEVKLVDEDNNLLDTLDVNYGSSLGSIADPVKEGFSFLGWYLEDVLFDFNTIITTDLTLVGKFEPLSDGQYIYLVDEDFDLDSNNRYVYNGNLEYVVVPEKINGEFVVSVAYMFSGTSVKGVKLAAPERVRNMDYMFRDSTATELNVEDLDTSSVQSMIGMFWGVNIPELDLTSFDFSKVGNIRALFQNASIGVINLSNANMVMANDLSQMFYNVTATTVNVSNMNTERATSMYSMFRDSNIENLILDNLNTSSVKDMGYMFGNSKTLLLDLSTLDTSSATNMDGMFMQSKATILDLSNFDTSSVLSMRMMFYASETLEINFSSFDTSNVTNMYWMFRGSHAEELDLSSFNTLKVTTMEYMFAGAKASVIDISSFDTPLLTLASGMFSEVKVAELDFTNFKTHNVTSMGSMFSGAEVTNGLDLSTFDTSSVTSMAAMFANSKIPTINLSSFNTENVTDFRSIFFNVQMNVLDLSSFKNTSAIQFELMFDAATIGTLDFSGFEFTSTPSRNIFGTAVISAGYAKSSVEAGFYNSRVGSGVFTVK